jgi:hypothetical protein
MKALIKSDFPEGITANIDIPTDKKVEVVIDNLIPHSLSPVPEDTIRFFVTTEPMGDFNRMILENQNCFTYVLTQFPQLLTLKNSVKLAGCGSFVDPAPDIKKNFAVSTVITYRNVLPGHFLRHELYRRRKEIKIPFDIYAGTWNETFEGKDTILMPPWPNRKQKVMIMDCMFHICIEGFKRIDQYSEKLIDSLITKTVPIYWGCINIGDYFNEQGIIQVNSVDEIIDVCRILTPEVYERMLPVVNDNYELALKVYKYEDILRDAMIKAVNK